MVVIYTVKIIIVIGANHYAVVVYETIVVTQSILFDYCVLVEIANLIRSINL